MTKRPEYNNPFIDARLKYSDLMLAEYKFREELAKINLTCPACYEMATLNYDGHGRYYWISCTQCGLRTSNSTDFCAVSYQWDALWERPLDTRFKNYLGKPAEPETEGSDSDLELQ